jgi:hypothetical protein
MNYMIMLYELNELLNDFDEHYLIQVDHIYIMVNLTNDMLGDQDIWVMVLIDWCLLYGHEQ